MVSVLDSLGFSSVFILSFVSSAPYKNIIPIEIYDAANVSVRTPKGCEVTMCRKPSEQAIPLCQVSYVTGPRRGLWVR